MNSHRGDLREPIPATKRRRIYPAPATKRELPPGPPEPSQYGYQQAYQPHRPGLSTPYGSTPPQAGNPKLTSMGTGMKMLCCLVAVLLYGSLSFLAGSLSNYIVQLNYTSFQKSFPQVLSENLAATIAYPGYTLIGLTLFGLLYAFFVFRPPKWNNFGLQILAGFVAGLVSYLIVFTVVTLPIMLSMAGGAEALGFSLVGGLIHHAIVSVLTLTLNGFIFFQTLATARHGSPLIGAFDDRPLSAPRSPVRRPETGRPHLGKRP